METIYPDTMISGDGSSTLSHPLIGEMYHSTAGAVGESLHVYIANGLAVASETKKEIRLLEMGFGSGLNALLTIDYALKNRLSIQYNTIELYPIDLHVIESLNYNEYVSSEAYALYMECHKAKWNETVRISDNFTIHKINRSITEICVFPLGIDLIYYDAFAPDSQPELWSETLFGKLFKASCDDAILVTYSAKGIVKQALRAAGFTVKRRPGALGKHHQLFCQKIVVPQEE